MKRKPAAPVFKPYVMNQAALLPPSYDELIPANHLVRVVNEAVEKIDGSALLAQYKGGGTSSYHPKMLLKVLVYAYAERIYSSQRIGKALRATKFTLQRRGEDKENKRDLPQVNQAELEDIFLPVNRPKDRVAEHLGLEAGHQVWKVLAAGPGFG